MAKRKAQTKNLPLRLRDPIVQFAFALLLFIFSAILVSNRVMPEWEKQLFYAVYDLPSALTPLFLVITQLGNVTVFFVLAGLYMLKRHYHLVLRLLMTGSLAYLLSGVAKDLLGRPRPTELLIDVLSRDYLIRGPGFPSGHVALATAVALTIGYHLPRGYHWLVPVAIIAVGLSRVYLGVHAPLDIIGGFAIGWMAYALFRNVRFSDIHRNVKRRSTNVLKKPVARTKLK